MRRENRSIFLLVVLRDLHVLVSMYVCICMDGTFSCGHDDLMCELGGGWHLSHFFFTPQRFGGSLVLSSLTNMTRIFISSPAAAFPHTYTHAHTRVNMYAWPVVCKLQLFAPSFEPDFVDASFYTYVSRLSRGTTRAGCPSAISSPRSYSPPCTYITRDQ